ncbi:YciI family protein [Falsirhodobacter sp. alg1]|uniref:YciI family protein n=1 Tax=Falsirhodobacter sp. alg1 TaxID=1472418 RepID=UPI0005EF1D0A|nr:YciI family protein [Falsirhodobacter sp. alg1]
MLVALICKDKPGALTVRQENRTDHLAYAEATGVVFLAGPFMNEAGEMTGSLVILDVADLDAARAWAGADPYAKAGLFQSVEIQEWKKVIG